MGFDELRDGLRTNSLRAIEPRKPPRWKTREEKTPKGRSLRRKLRVRHVACPVCGAKKGWPCVKPGGGRRQHPHRERWARAEAASRALSRRNQIVAAASKRRWESVTVSFECPICGGAHSRHDHTAREQERDEIKKAKREGRAEEYIRAQREERRVQTET